MDPNLYLDTVSKKLKRVTQEAKDAKKAIIYNLCSQLKEEKKTMTVLSLMVTFPKQSSI